jgi:hypothetical protein
MEFEGWKGTHRKFSAVFGVTSELHPNNEEQALEKKGEATPQMNAQS